MVWRQASSPDSYWQQVNDKLQIGDCDETSVQIMESLSGGRLIHVWDNRAV